MAELKLIKGTRRELEYELLTALFTPGANATAESLSRRLAPRGNGQIRALRTYASSMSDESLPAAQPIKKGDGT